MPWLATATIATDSQIKAIKYSDAKKSVHNLCICGILFFATAQLKCLMQRPVSVVKYLPLLPNRFTSAKR